MFSWLRKAVSSTPRSSPRPARRMLEFERLEERTVPAGVIAVGTGAGVAPLVALFHDTNNDGVPDSAAFAVFPVLTPAFRGGVRVAVGHFTGTTTLQLVVAAGPGNAPMVQVFQLNASDVPTGEVESFLAAGAGFRNGLFVARAHTGGAALDSLIVSADAGGAGFVKVYNDGTAGDHLLANSLVDAFLPFGAGYRGGVRVAASRNLTGGAISDSVALTTGPGIVSRVVILKDSNNNVVISDNLATREVLFPGGHSYKGGFFVAVGDVGSPSANAELIVSKDAGSPPRVYIFADTNNNGKYGDDVGPVASFLAFGADYRGGVRVAYSRLSPAAANLQAELMVAPAFGRSPVKVFKAVSNGEIQPTTLPLAQFFPFGPNFTHGYFIAFGGNGS